MEPLIQLDSYPVQTTLKLLLQDKTTGHNIMWATDSYEYLGERFSDKSEITAELICGINSNQLQPRILKANQDQAERTRKHAEVFTPAWVCNIMNNNCDEEWFGRAGVFNSQTDTLWAVNEAPITFPNRKTWTDYVDSRRLEITCGEAPFIVSRYDAATGEPIELQRRIGILDRKLRVVNENASDELEWLKWSLRAFQSVYGYEFQGDNLLIARINLIMTFADYLGARFHRQPDAGELKKVANVIAWNIWQMDGLKGTIPLGIPEASFFQFSFFESEQSVEEKTNCRIMDWRKDRSLQYLDLKKGNQKS